ncbi:hypothetical protein [Chitinophaga defluvii]|uniref:ABC-2 family transporter n=1 Tax=Chitinophaga defluvii TaxID=3163343 RepID=A0ABV2TA90_9BACT
MHTNNVFNLNRFGLYIRKHLVDNYRLYGMSMVVLFVLVLVVMVTTYFTRGTINKITDILPMYCIGILFSGMIFTSASFSEFANKPKGVNYLMLPASHFEKFLTVFLFTTIGFLVIYHIVFYGVYLWMDAIAFSRTQKHMLNDLASDRGITKTLAFYSCFVWFLLHSIFLLGATCFEKSSFLKTIFLLVIVLFLLYLINTLFLELFFGSKLQAWNHHVPMLLVALKKERTTSGMGYSFDTLVFLPKQMQHIFAFAGTYLIIPFLWVVAYFRLKEKEI